MIMSGVTGDRLELNARLPANLRNPPCSRRWQLQLTDVKSSDAIMSWPGVPGDRLELNARLAATLNSPVLMALDVHKGQAPADVARSALIAKNSVEEARATVLGLVVNQVSKGSGPGLPIAAVGVEGICGRGVPLFPIHREDLRM